MVVLVIVFLNFVFICFLVLEIWNFYQRMKGVLLSLKTKNLARRNVCKVFILEGSQN